MSDLHFGLSDIVLWLSIVVSFTGILTFFDSRRKSAAKEAKDAAATLKADILDGQKVIEANLNRSSNVFEHRITSLENENRHYVPKPDIEKDFEHEKRGRIEADNAAAVLIQRLRDDMTVHGERIAKLEQNDTYLANTINDLKVSMKESFGKTDSKLDRVCDSLAALDKKVA